MQLSGGNEIGKYGYAVEFGAGCTTQKLINNNVRIEAAKNSNNNRTLCKTALNIPFDVSSLMSDKHILEPERVRRLLVHLLYIQSKWW